MYVYQALKRILVMNNTSNPQNKKPIERTPEASGGRNCSRFVSARFLRNFSTDLYSIIGLDIYGFFYFSTDLYSIMGLDIYGFFCLPVFRAPRTR